ncbi:MAG: restriction endonuclease subunit S [Bacteroidales bacterium]|nr:restriction endonuclease subunit S [Bacteroidales bacterium]
MKIVKLKDIANILSGVYLRPSPAGEIAYLQVSDLQRQSPEKTAVKVEFVRKLRQYMLQEGDILLAGKGNYLCKTFELDIPAVPSTTLYIIRPNTDTILPEYINWYLNLPQTISLIKSVQVGSGIPLIHKSTLENIEIPLPPIKVQMNIVKISILQQQEKELLENIAQKRFQIVNQILINELNK